MACAVLLNRLVACAAQFTVQLAAAYPAAPLCMFQRMWLVAAAVAVAAAAGSQTNRPIRLG
jgi:disulfide bond formation protein DsbB